MIDKEKLIEDLIERDDRIRTVIAMLRAGIDWETPKERAEFELNAKRLWLCDQIGIPYCTWEEIVDKFVFNAVQLEKIERILQGLSVQE